MEGVFIVVGLITVVIVMRMIGRTHRQNVHAFREFSNVAELQRQIDKLKRELKTLKREIEEMKRSR